MDDLLAVTLVARHLERNHHREYRISVGRDLFGEWTVTVRYGRVGRGGQERRAAGVVEALRRRLQVSARVRRDSIWQVIPARELVPGDDQPVLGGNLRTGRGRGASDHAGNRSCPAARTCSVVGFIARF